MRRNAAWNWVTERSALGIHRRAVPGCFRIVDIFHAEGYLRGIATAISGPAVTLPKQWTKAPRDELDADHINAILGALQTRAKIQEFRRGPQGIDYMSPNRARMRYPAFRAHGLSVRCADVA